MKYFKNTENKVFAFESDGSQDHLITEVMTEIDEADLQSVIDANRSIDDLMTEKHAEIISKFRDAMRPISGLYTDEEIASWPTQVAEAEAWLANNSVPTPFIDGLLSNRPSVDKATLAQRIIDNAANYKTYASPVMSKKQHYEDQLYALKAQQADPEQPDVTKADIDAIVVDYSS